MVSTSSTNSIEIIPVVFKGLLVDLQVLDGGFKTRKTNLCKTLSLSESFP